MAPDSMTAIRPAIRCLTMSPIADANSIRSTGSAISYWRRNQSRWTTGTWSSTPASVRCHTVRTRSVFVRASSFTVASETLAASATAGKVVRTKPRVVNSRSAASMIAVLVCCARRSRTGESYRRSLTLSATPLPQSPIE